MPQPPRQGFKTRPRWGAGQGRSGRLRGRDGLEVVRLPARISAETASILERRSSRRSVSRQMISTSPRRRTRVRTRRKVSIGSPSCTSSRARRACSAARSRRMPSSRATARSRRRARAITRASPATPAIRRAASERSCPWSKKKHRTSSSRSLREGVGRPSYIVVHLLGCAAPSRQLQERARQPPSSGMLVGVDEVDWPVCRKTKRETKKSGPDQWEGPAR